MKPWLKGINKQIKTWGNSSVVGFWINMCEALGVIAQCWWIAKPGVWSLGIWFHGSHWPSMGKVLGSVSKYFLLKYLIRNIITSLPYRSQIYFCGPPWLSSHTVFPIHFGHTVIFFSSLGRKGSRKGWAVLDWERAKITGVLKPSRGKDHLWPAGRG